MGPERSLGWPTSLGQGWLQTGRGCVCDRGEALRVPRPQSQDAGPLPRLQAPSRGAGGAIWASPSPNTGLDRGSGRGGREAARPRRGLSFPQVGPQLGLSGRSPEPVDSAPRTTAGDKALAGDSAATRGARWAARGGHRPTQNGHTWRGVSPQATGPWPSRRRHPPHANPSRLLTGCTVFSSRLV